MGPIIRFVGNMMEKRQIRPLQGLWLDATMDTISELKKADVRSGIVQSGIVGGLASLGFEITRIWAERFVPEATKRLRGEK